MNAPAPGALRLEDAAHAHIDAITEIYSHHVRTGFGTFEEEPPSATQMTARFDAITGAGLPYLVALIDDRVVGYCYATPYRPRSAYRYTLEDSIYVAADAQRRGIGVALLSELVARCARIGFKQMVAVIGDSGNAASIAVHARCGFHQIGILRDVGYKRERWLDTVIMQRHLGD